MKTYSNWKKLVGFKLSGLLFRFILVYFCCFILISLNESTADDLEILPQPEINQTLTKIAAKNIIIPKIEEMWVQKNQKIGLRAHQYGNLLPEGTQVRSASLTNEEKSTALICENDCWLFFIDEAPGAHFEHPVRIIVVDAKTGVQKVLHTNMWPLIKQPGIQEKALFGTFLERSNPATIILEKHAVLGPSSELLPDLQALPPSDPFFPFEIDESCDSWAVIVCGFNDLPDTFDEDTNGIYSVFKGLGVADDHIFYLSPHTSHAGVDRQTTYANVQWAINEVASLSGPNDKMLFFYSSHGGIDSLSCVPDISPPGEKSISASNLDNWLDAITCAELSIIIEACHSGSLIGLYADGTYVSSEDDLTGDGETNRAVFTSASTDTSSYPDRDDPGDPNPSDTGSETIWGYVEAFSVPAADVNTDGAVSFGEAFQYAWDNDVTRILGWNTPQMVHTELNIDNLFHHCYPVCDSDGPYVLDCEDALAGIILDGTFSEDPAPCEALAYSWTTDCTGGVFDDPTSPTPLFALSPENACVECDVSLTVSCLDGSWEQCSTPVIVSDHSAPSITCPSDIDIECHESTDPANTGSASAADNCALSPDIEYNDQMTPGSCLGDYTITRTWKAIDGCGNMDTCSQLITVSDNTPPTLYGVPANVTVECDAVPEMGSVSASDNCDTAPATSFSETRIDGICPSNYTLTRTWTATDACGNRTVETQIITVQDTTPPVISVVSTSPTILWPPNHKMSSVNVDSVASDNCDGEPVCKIAAIYSNEPIDGIGDGRTAPDWVITGNLTADLRAERSGNGDGRVYTIVVECSDACGNSSSQNTAVTVPHDKKK